MYILMNKDKEVLTFRKANISVFDDITFEVIDKYGLLPYGFESINSWISSRKASSHNKHLKEIMQALGCEDNEGFIRLTHAVGINDTFWIKSEDEHITWKSVSLYDNQFSEVISRLAFEGIGLYGEIFSSASPELTCDGSFRKCFRKENQKGQYSSDIYLYKRGGDLGHGLEPYCEMLTSEIAQILAPNLASVKYDICLLNDKLASRCNIFTDEGVGYASFAKVSPLKEPTFDDIFRFFVSIGSEQSFRELLLIDAICFNQDRHTGNYGVLFNTETMQIIRMSPVFDFNISMLPYVTMQEFANIGDKLYEYAPKLGSDFTRLGQIAINDKLRDRLKYILDFSFSFRGDDKFSEQRVEALEAIVRRQAKAILSNSKLYTKDVFYSVKAGEKQLL